MRWIRWYSGMMYDRWCMWLAWHLPKSVVKWCTIRAFAHATSGIYSGLHPDRTNYSDVMTRWEQPNEG